MIQKISLFANCVWKFAIIIILIVISIKLDEIRHTELALNNTYKEIYVHETMDEPIPNSEFKSYMDYRTITDVTSLQYALQTDAITDEKGFRRLNGMYMVALGSNYGAVGDVFAITLEGNTVFLAVKGDEKQDIHTINGYGIQAYDGSVVEFIVDTEALPEQVKLMGDCSYAGFYYGVVSIEQVKL